MIIAIVMIMIHRWEGWVRCILVDTNLNILKTLKITMISTIIMLLYPRWVRCIWVEVVEASRLDFNTESRPALVSNP